MIRNLKTISRSLGAIAVLAVTTGCPTDDPKNPGQSLQTPTAPFAGIQITVGTSRSTLQVGNDNLTAVISIQVLRVAGWTPVADGTDATFSATLGAIDSPTGGREVTIDLVNGTGSITLYPGTQSGTARVTISAAGGSAVVNLTINPDPDADAVPAPTQSTLTVTANPGTISEQDAVDDGAEPTTVTITATVLGSDGEPFGGAGIFFTTPLGTFSNGNTTSPIVTTSGAGMVSVTLSIEDAALLGFLGNSFQVVAHLGIEGGERTASVTIFIVAGPAPLEAASIFLSATTSTTIDEDDGVQTVSLDAEVRDQNTDPLDGAVVQFLFGAGGGPGNFVPASEATGSDSATGHATVMLSATEAEVEAFPLDQFTVIARTTTSGGTISSNSVVITINRTAAPALTASFTVDDPTPCHLSGEGDSTVQFTDTSTGSILTWSWDLDGDGSTTDSNVADPLFDYGDGSFAAGVEVNVTLIVSDGVASDSISMIITPTDCTP